MKVTLNISDQTITGVGFGYTVLKRELRNGLIQSGVRLVDNAEVVLHCCEPYNFKPIAGKRNVLFTMWESPSIDDNRKARLRSADALITCSSFCADLFKRWAPHVQCSIVHLGVDDVFAYRQRTAPAPGRPFRWLWCGAPNPRKGWDVVGRVWNKAFLNDPRLMLYMKTTGVDTDRLTLQENNVFFDYRTVSTADLAAIYQGCHGFLFPTAGEGFGLTLAEAMATGLPCIATRWSGHLDFTNNRNAYLVDYQLIETQMTNGDVLISAVASPQHVANRMIEVMRDYKSALKRGKVASRRIKHLTWQRTTKGVVSALTKASSRESYALSAA